MKSLLAFALVHVLFFFFLHFYGASGTTTLYVAELTGGGVSPAINTTFAKGLAFATYSNTTRILNITVMHNLTSPDNAVFAQVQSYNYTIGLNGIPIAPIISTVYPFDNTTSPIAQNGINITADQEKLLFNNTFFFVIHTYKHISGEIRGTLRPNKFNGTVEYGGVQKPPVIITNSTNSTHTNYAAVSYFLYNCMSHNASLRFLHNINETITIRIFGITNASLHMNSTQNLTASLSSSINPHRGKNNNNNNNRRSNLPLVPLAPSLPPYISIFNYTANPSGNYVNVVNVTMNTTTLGVNFTTFIGGILRLEVFNSNNSLILSGFLNQTDKDTCKTTALPPLSAAQEAAIGGWVAITIGMMLIGLTYRLYCIRKSWLAKKKKKADKYQGAQVAKMQI